MRLDEISVNKESIKKTLLYYFDIIGDITIDDHGYVSVDGDCQSYSEDTLTELPILFNQIDGNFLCTQHQLTTLIGCPKKVRGNFACDNNQLKSLVGGPKIVHGSYYCTENPLKSLDGLPESVGGRFSLTINDSLPLLKLLFIKHVKIIYIERDDQTSTNDVQNILNKYLGQGRKGALQCAAELTKAGFKGNARL